MTAQIQALERERQEALKQLGPRDNKQAIERQLSDLSTTLNVLKRLEQELPSVVKDKKDLNRRIQKLEETLDKLGERNQKILTPFGTFETHPRLGLLLLAFASIGAYLAFVAAEAGVISFARSIAALNEPSKPQMKFWLFPLDPRLPKEWQTGEGKKVFASFILQVAWLLLGALLVLECTRWNKVEPHWLGSLWFISIVLWLGISIQALFVARRIVRLLPLQAVAWVTPYVQGLGAHFTRRQVLVGTATSVALLLVGRWFWSKLLPSALRPIQGQDLVGNSATGVVHHKRVCVGHLPKLENQTSGNTLPGRARLHGSRAVNIYEALQQVSFE